MRGKVAKRIRRAAERHTAGKPARAYGVHRGREIRLDPKCTRSLYQRSKRVYGDLRKGVTHE